MDTSEKIAISTKVSAKSYLSVKPVVVFSHIQVTGIIMTTPAIWTPVDAGCKVRAKDDESNGEGDNYNIGEANVKCVSAA